MLKIEQLRCFAQAVRDGSFAEAGKSLNLSPSAVAYNVEMLEAGLKTTLLFRKQANGVAATSDGRRLLARADLLLKELVEVEELFSGQGGALSGDLIVGCQEGLSWSLIPRAIERLGARYPLINVTQRTIFMNDGNSHILSGSVDVLITFALGLATDVGVHAETLCEPATYALMRADHPLTRAGDSVTLAELARFPQVFILDGPVWDFFTGMYNDKGLSPELSKVCNISSSAQAIVGRSDSVSLRAVKPAHDMSPLGDHLAFRRISDATRNLMIVAAWPKNKHNRVPAKIEAFVGECHSLFADGSMRAHLFY